MTLFTGLGRRREENVSSELITLQLEALHFYKFILFIFCPNPRSLFPVRAAGAECGGGAGGGAGAGAAHQAERAGRVLQRQAGRQAHHRQEEAEQVG